jgi:hypothetical protein
VTFCISLWGWPPTVTDAQPYGPVVKALSPLLEEKK